MNSTKAPPIDYLTWTMKSLPSASHTSSVLISSRNQKDTFVFHYKCHRYSWFASLTFVVWNTEFASHRPFLAAYCPITLQFRDKHNDHELL